MATKERSKLAKGTVPLSVALHANGLKLRTAPESFIVEHVTALVEASKRHKEQYWVPTWLRMLYFFLGYMQINWNRDRGKFFPIPVHGDQRVTVNMVQNRVLTLAAQDIQAKPIWDVVPDRDDATAREQARVALKVLRSEWDVAHGFSKQALAALQRALFGISFRKVEWNPHRKILPPQPVVSAPLGGVGDGSPADTLADGRTQVKLGPPRVEGGVEITLPSVFDLHFPPSTCWPMNELWSWAAEHRAVPVGDIMNRWNAEVPPDENAVEVTTELNHDLGHFFDEGFTTWSDSRAADSAWVTEYYEPPSLVEGFEGGVRILVSTKKLLADPEESPLSDGTIPIYPFPMIPVPFTPWGTSQAMNMQEPNMVYNKSFGHMNAMLGRMSNPILMGQRGSLVADHVTDGRRFLEYEEGTRGLEVVRTSELNEAVIAALQESKQAVDISSGSFPFQRGQTVGKSPQAVQTVQILKEADGSDLAIGQAISTESFGKAGDAVLDIVRNEYDSERVGRVLGDNEDAEIFSFRGSDISNKLKARVQESSALPHLKQAAQQKLGQMISSGVLNRMLEQEPGLMKHLFEVFELPTPEIFESLYDVHKRKQEREIRAMIQRAQPVEPGPRENDQAHLEVLDRYINTVQFEQLDPQIQAALVAHAEAHQQRLQAQQEAQLQQQLALQQLQSQGQGPGPGQPPA